MSDLPTSEEVIAWYDERLSKRKTDYHKRVHAGLDRILMGNERSVLDLGCGCGVSSLYMGKQGATVVGVDFSPKRIEFAQKRLSNRNVTYVCDDIFTYRAETEEDRIDRQRRFEIITLIDVVDRVDPGRLKNLVETVLIHAHSRTLVYVSYTMSGFTAYRAENDLEEERPRLETQIPLSLLLAMFDKAGFVPMGVETFGTVSPTEHWEIIFITKMHMNDVWQEIYQPASLEDVKDVPKGTLDKENN